MYRLYYPSYREIWAIFLPLNHPKRNKHAPELSCSAHAFMFPNKLFWENLEFAFISLCGTKTAPEPLFELLAECQWSCDKFTGEYWFWGKIWTALPLNLRTELYQGPQVLFKQNRLYIILVTFHLRLTKLWLFGNVMCQQVGNSFFSMIPPIWSIILSREIFWKSAET